MPAYIMFIHEMPFDESRIEVYGSKAPPTLDGRPIKVLAPNRRHVALERPEITGVVVAEFPSLEVASALYEYPAHQAGAQRQFDSWLADMEYCDRF